MYVSPTRPICACGRPMKCVKNGAAFVEVDNNNNPWAAYSCDLYLCFDCGTKILCGIAEKPFVTSWDYLLEFNNNMMTAVRKFVRGKEEFIFMEKVC